MRLGIFGDSFCLNVFNNTSTSWANNIEYKYQTVNNYAASGTSLWYSFDKFLSNYHKHDAIIFGYTSAHRIHYLPDDLVRWSFLNGPSNHIEIPEYDKSRLATVWKARHLTWNENFDLFVYQHIFNDVNAICQKNNIKLINLLPFEGYPDKQCLIDISGAIGPCVTELSVVSDLGRPNNWVCHISQRNNDALCELLCELLADPQPKIFPITEDSRFKDDYHEIQQ